MKQFLFIAIILFSTSFTFAQIRTEVPLTQAEYVKMLYEAEKSEAAKQDLIEAIRRRGIGFELTPGLRSLTTTKSRNDSELKRTLEESERRRKNPNAAKLPSEEEARDLIEKTRQNTLESVEEMPDFVVKQTVNRKIAYAGTNNWKSLDKLLIAVSYSSKKGEQYQVLAINGARVEAEKGNNYGGLNGASTSGEFVETLKNIFNPESKTDFNLIDTDLLRNNSAVVFEYSIELKNNKNGGISYRKYGYASIPTGEKGKIWIDRKNFRVLKVEYESTEIPVNFPVRAFHQTIDYDWVTISDQKYLLPIQSSGTFTATSDVGLLQSQNIIKFKDYQKFGTEVIVLDDDVEDVPEEEQP